MAFVDSIRVIAMITAIGIGAAMAEGSALPPIEHAATLKECSDCHMPYPPQMLPMRSWQKVMADLANHFGDNAALPEPTRTDIETYLVTHAGDAPGTTIGQPYVRGIAADQAPLRITGTPFWNRVHAEVSPAQFKSASVKSPANCGACHQNARQGQFGEVE